MNDPEIFNSLKKVEIDPNSIKDTSDGNTSLLGVIANALLERRCSFVEDEDEEEGEEWEN